MCRYNEAVSQDWKQVALELNLQGETVNRINKDYNCLKDKCYEMFNTWLQRTPEACWCHMVNALKMCKMLKLAKDIEESFMSE